MEVNADSLDRLLEEARSMRTLIAGSDGVWRWHAEDGAPNASWAEFECVRSFLDALAEWD